jgi:hypothetical protein
MNDDGEIKAITELVAILSPLDRETAIRVIQWAANRYGADTGWASAKTMSNRVPGTNSTYSPETTFADLAELYHAAAPTTDAERALIVGYWFQQVQQDQSLDAQRVNAALKQLGYGLTNITSAFTDLIEGTPSLAIQIQKGGSTQQARKKYKLTIAGLRKVQQMISARNSSPENAE